MLIESCITDAFVFYRKLRQVERNTALLESLDQCEPGRSSHTFIGACAQQILTVRKGESLIMDLCTGLSRPVPDWRAVVDAWVPLHDSEAGQIYQTGCMGYIGYDRKDDFERYDACTAPDTAMPDVCLVLYGAVLVLDRATGKATWVVDDERFARRVGHFENLARSGVEQPTEPFALCGDITCDTSQVQHREQVERIVEYIRAGDVFQVNLTARYSGRYQGDVVHVYEALRKRTPNPYFALLDFPQPLISTSPERFLSINAGTVTASPIKGTVRCEVDGIDQQDNLIGSPKNRAENVMIADLMRNDLGRICDQGSVRVEQLCEVRRFNQLYHLESTISGQLREGFEMSQVLAATFPCGSITGAPKIRAVEIIDELEQHRRGPYCGAIGFFGSQGRVQTSVGIRIIYFDHGQLHFHAGGGIVIDSDAADEFAELNLKVETLKSTLESFNVMNDVRGKIDAIDEELFKILHQRFEAIREATRIKIEYDVPVVQRARMEQMVAYRKARLRDFSDIPETCISDLYAVLTAHSMRLEHRAKH